jgi:amino acid adenylation domain-containing protein/non-ribosomal peptide synthase protein (TIGR01720 family)
VASWDGSLTYEELDVKAVSVAHQLRGLGIGPGSIVPFCFEKSFVTIVAILAILKAGAAFTAIDPKFPESWRECIIRDTNAQVVVTQSQFADFFAKNVKGTLQLDVDSIGQAGSDGRGAALSYAESAPADLAYVAFTSGTTGKPKGVLIQHRAFCTSALAHGTDTGMSSSSRVLQFASHTFDVSIQEILTTLIYGGCVCVPSEDERQNNLENAINRLRANWAKLTPTVVRLLEPRAVPGLKTLVVGGEAIGSDIITSWASKVQLIVSYGPAECSVISATTTALGPDAPAGIIGRSTGCCLWVVDPEDHHQLVNPGSVGELLVQGHTLAQGYLGDENRTQSSFITDPQWSMFPDFERRRMYKTGDLVRQDEDGVFHYVMRKDFQVKVNGQRVELGEIEHHILSVGLVRHTAVVMPKAGPWAGSLVALLSLSNLEETLHGEQCLNILSSVHRDLCRKAIKALREVLETHLPDWMTPRRWIVVDRFPRLLSGKMDRRRVLTWLESLAPTDCTRALVCEEGKGIFTPSTDMEQVLQVVWAHVLNIDTESVDLTAAFNSLGGDSISAMLAVAHSRSRGIAVTVHDILHRKAIIEIARRCRWLERGLHYGAGQRPEQCEAEPGSPFPLTPIQLMHFNSAPKGQNHYNQSFLVHLTQSFPQDAVGDAIEQVVRRHPMLRARFYKNGNGSWYQIATDEVHSSFRYRQHSINRIEDASAILQSSQCSLDINTGPILAAELLETSDEQQFLFIAAHHLVVDLVSFRIMLQDIENYLLKETLKPIGSLSFRRWALLQMQYARGLDATKVLPYVVPEVSLNEYWGVDAGKNMYRNLSTISWSLDKAVTSRLLGPAHVPFNTETHELVLASITYSFSTIFKERSLPPIHFEGHGRRTWSDEIDLSSTVGWFTTMTPLCVPLPSDDDSIAGVVRATKDAIRSIPHKGLDYFSARYLQDTVRSKEESIEILVNYFGVFQQLERPDSLLRRVKRGRVSVVDKSPDMHRPQLFEISVEIDMGELHFTLEFPESVQRRDDIASWAVECRRVLGLCAQTLPTMEPAPTASDFPLMDFNGDAGLSEFLKSQVTERLAISVRDIEDVYPCTPMQDAILVSQSRNEKLYRVQYTFELTSGSNDRPVNGDRLEQAWRRVVQQAPILRTVFADDTTGRGLFTQVVLKKVDAVVRKAHGISREAFLATELKLGEHNRLPHCIGIWDDGTGSVCVKLAMSHAITDGTSSTLLIQEIARLYSDRSLQVRGPPFHDFISFLRSLSQADNISYWSEFLAGAEPCLFPALRVETPGCKDEVLHEEITFRGDILHFCIYHDITAANLFQTLWAFVLCVYLDRDDVVFGYLSSGRDASLPGIDIALGPYITIMAGRLQLDQSRTLLELVRRVQRNVTESMAYQHCSLAFLQHELQVGGNLFNTMVDVQKRPRSGSVSPGLSVDIRNVEDPTEYNLILNVEVEENKLVGNLTYAPSCLSPDNARNFTSTLLRILDQVLDSPNKRVVDLDLFSEAHGHRIMPWNKGHLPVSNSRAHTLIEDEVNSYPDAAAICSLDMELTYRQLSQLWGWNINVPPAIERSIHEMIEEQVRARPGAPAVHAWDGELTYGELDDLATNLAYQLAGLGIRSGAVVPLCFEKSIWTTVAVLAVLKAGAAFCMLDPAHPENRLKSIVQQTAATVILSSTTHLTLSSRLVARAIAVGPGPILDANDSHKIRALPRSDPSSLMYVVFTSGSMGHPKGVLISHRAFCTNIHYQASRLGFTTTSRVFDFAAHAFDIFVYNSGVTLATGGCLCVPSERDRKNNLTVSMIAMSPSVAVVTPSVARLLDPGAVKSLSTVVFVGEPSAVQDIERWWTHATVVNAYGPSECTPNSVINCSAEDPLSATRIGKGAGAVTWVVDPNNHNRLVPIGVVGELLLEGPLLGDGYLNDHEKTAAAFIEDPEWLLQGTANHPGRRGRLYKTGDLVRYHKDGSIGYVGRKDTQVKIRGQRVELGEVEYHVRECMLEAEHAEQLAAEVIVPGNDDASPLLAVFLSGGGGYQPEDSPADRSSDKAVQSGICVLAVPVEAEGRLAERLPCYMVPTVCFVLPRLPMTITDKINRKRLREIGASYSVQQLADLRSKAQGDKRMASTDTERRLQQLWARVLNIDPASIGVEDSFFQLGGDSITAMKLVAEARSVDLQLSVADIFQQPTILASATLAASCKGRPTGRG